MVTARGMGYLRVWHTGQTRSATPAFSKLDQQSTALTQASHVLLMTTACKAQSQSWL